MSREERERDGHSHSSDDRFCLAAGRERWASAGALDGPRETLCACSRQPVPFPRPRVLTAVSVLCILCTAQLRQDELSNQVEGGCLW